MRFISFQIDGRPSYGVLESEAVADIGSLISNEFPTLRAAIASGILQNVQNLRARAATRRLKDIELSVPIVDASKIVCIGRNYKDHVAEAGLKLPEFPNFFLRTYDSFVSPGRPLLRPKVSEQFDFEGEVAVVIGKPGHCIKAKAALDHVFGYTCLNDGSIRDYQFNHSLVAGKNFYSSGSFGPAILTADEAPDPSKLTITTRLNGSVVQNSSLEYLIFDIPTLIEYVSSIFPLNSGDIISTGTPEGVGLARKPPLWMKPSDSIEVEASGVGVLKNIVEDAA